MYYTYILRCNDESYYIGYTSNMKRRFEEHKSGNGCKYTRAKGVKYIEIYWSTIKRSDAMKLEYYLKTLTRNQKMELIENPDLLGGKYGTNLVAEYTKIEVT